MAFMPFITAGDPDLNATCELIRELAKRQVDLIEIGFPYSDPIADGPVIQASYTRALKKGFRVADLFDAVKTLTTDSESPVTVPLVGMVSYAIIFRMGCEAFLKRAQSAGFAGLIVPDLPGDEAEEFAKLARQHELDLIQLISPMTPWERVETILKSCSGFVYCISVAGTTGVRDQLPTELSDQLRELRNRTDLPLAVGFGINKPEHLDSLRGLADGAIIGSGIVRFLEPAEEGAEPTTSAISQIGEFVEQMVQSAHRAS